MKINVTVCTKQQARIVGGFSLCLLLNSSLIWFFNPTGIWIVFLVIFAAVQFYAVISFADNAPMGAFRIDTRTEQDKYMENQETLYALMEGKRNQLIYEVIEGERTKESAEKVLNDLNDFIEKQKLLI